VVDDAFSGIDQVVRGDDLLPVAAAQTYLAGLLGHDPPSYYAHVPLAVNTEGRRLAKRDGTVTLPDLAAQGVGPRAVIGLIAQSLDLAAPGEQITIEIMLERFDPARLPRSPWVVDPWKVHPDEWLP
jgi:glutamyl-tRNA synthetase